MDFCKSELPVFPFSQLILNNEKSIFFMVQIYTTKLDKSKAGISEKEAARIAREIEGRKTNNPHQAEERGQIQYREMVRNSISTAILPFSKQTQ